MDKRDSFNKLVSLFKNGYNEANGVANGFIRPPYVSDEQDFSACVTCEMPCAKACDENIIVSASDGTVMIDFTQGGCTYCDECANACPHGVLTRENKKNIRAYIQINEEKCLSWNKVMCMSCKDPCLDNAILFQGLFQPKIKNNCTSCGFCINICPTNAIEVFHD